VTDHFSANFIWDICLIVLNSEGALNALFAFVRDILLTSAANVDTSNEKVALGVHRTKARLPILLDTSPFQMAADDFMKRVAMTDVGGGCAGYHR
jgi:hypothetical protein